MMTVFMGYSIAKGEDTFKESKKLQSVHIEMALVSYLIDSKSIQQGQRTVVYDYQVMNSLYVFFQLTYCYGRFDYCVVSRSFTMGEEMINLLKKILFRKLLIQNVYNGDYVLSIEGKLLEGVLYRRRMCYSYSEGFLSRN